MDWHINVLFFLPSLDGVHVIDNLAISSWGLIDDFLLFLAYRCSGLGVTSTLFLPYACGKFAVLQVLMRFILFMQELSELKKTLNVEVEQLRAVSLLLNFSSNALFQIKFVCEFVHEIETRNFKIWGPLFSSNKRMLLLA